ncbi:hypothetical protein LCGC14_0965100 [marine sediment metagenome]|uniref:DUF5681 domain-containing protein n=1 Tax=marine sediment metagenome TaxID=412755 RepID=A0A0F9NDF9_9ZZZZ
MTINSSEQKNQLNRNGNRRGMHPNSIANLKPIPWVTGESGNPKGQSITARQNEMYDEVCSFDGKDRTWREALAEGGMRQALTIPVALSNLQDRQEGKVMDTPTSYQDNRVVYIIVSSEKAKELTEKIGEFGIFNREE